MISPSSVKSEGPALRTSIFILQFPHFETSVNSELHHVCQPFCLPFLPFPLIGLRLIPHSIYSTEHCALQTATHIISLSMMVTITTEISR